MGRTRKSTCETSHKLAASSLEGRAPHWAGEELMGEPREELRAARWQAEFTLVLLLSSIHERTHSSLGVSEIRVPLLGSLFQGNPHIRDPFFSQAPIIPICTYTLAKITPPHYTNSSNQPHLTLHGHRA